MSSLSNFVNVTDVRSEKAMNKSKRTRTLKEKKKDELINVYYWVLALLGVT